MKAEVEVQSAKRSDLIDITPQIRDVVRQSGIQSGICILTVPHTTAGVVVNENWDPSVCEDVLATLDRLVPWHMNYAHSEGNAAAHIKSCLVGTSELLHVDGGNLSLGRWQGILFAEFDGPRRRRVLVRVIPDPEE
jgi:secondary thiamine-phosphate synthase enzyme